MMAYGAGVAKISASTGIPVEDVEALVAAELERYPEIEPFFVTVKEEIERSRVPTSVFVQHPDLPARTCQLGKGYYRTPDGKVYCYVESPTPEFLAKRGTLQSFSPTEVKNYPVQGTGGEWAKAAMWLAVRAFAKQEWRERAVLVNQVHDAMYVDAHPDVKLEAAALLHACMEEASTFMEWYYDWPVPVPVPSDTSMGSSMAEEGQITDPRFPQLVREYRDYLRREFMRGYTPTFDKE